MRPSLKNIMGQRVSGKEESIHLNGGSENQRLTDIADLESKVQEDLNPSPELFCSAVIYDENHTYLAVCEKGTKWGKTHEMP